MQIPPTKITFPLEDRDEILERVDQCLSTGRLTMGDHCRQFERNFAQYVGVEYAVAVNSGTSAIEIPLRVFDVVGKEVLVPTNTFFATPAAIIHAGGIPRFIEVDPETFSVDPDHLASCISSDTAGIIVVHVGGIITPRITDIVSICQQNDLFLLEDAAHAHGSVWHQKMAGSFGTVASFSFYPTKLMTSGEGGMIVTNEENIYRESLIYRDQGKECFSANFHTRLGYNWRMSEIHSILGISQLARLEEFIAVRRQIAKVYDQGLEDIQGITPLALPSELRCNYYKYIALLDDDIDRAQLKRLMHNRYGVNFAGEVYDIPCHSQPVFAEYVHGGLPVAELLCRRHVCLPVDSSMTVDEAEYVISCLRSVMRMADVRRM